MSTVLTDSRVRRQDSRSGNAHYRMKGVSPKPGAKKAPATAFAAAGTFSDFTYSGGPVIETPQVSVLFVGDWSSSANQTRATNLKQFVSDMLDSDYMNILSQYGCGSSGSLVGSATVPSPDHDLSAAEIHGILQSAIDDNKVPGASFSNAYILFLDDTTAVDDTTVGAVMCQASSDTAFGYHYFFKTTGGANCYYAVVPSLTDTCLKNSCASDSSCSLHLSQPRSSGRPKWPRTNSPRCFPIRKSVLTMLGPVSAPGTRTAISATAKQAPLPWVRELRTFS